MKTITHQLRSNGFGLDEARFPVGGAWELEYNESFRGDLEELRWTIRHVEN